MKRQTMLYFVKYVRCSHDALRAKQNAVLELKSHKYQHIQYVMEK